MSGRDLVFEIIFSPKAIRQMKKLERETQVRIKSAIERSLRGFPLEGDVVKLEGQKGVFRLRRSSHILHTILEI